MTTDAIKARRALAWANKSHWQRLLQEAYDYAIPNRQPTERIAEGAQRAVKLHDATASNLVFASAAQLRDDIAPPGQPLGRLRMSRLLRNRIRRRKDGKRQADAIAALLQDGNDVVNAMFLGGNFSSALLEVCIDSHVSTGAILMLEGTPRVPAMFASIPLEQIALEVDMFGRETLICWKQNLSRQAIYEAFPRGRYSKEWLDALRDKPQDRVEIEQCFVRRSSGMAWDMFVYLSGPGGQEGAVWQKVFKTCPVILMPFQRVPGEAYGRGPILTLLPTIKVLNSAQELQLKSFAIQMLGIWMYRKNGSFNPDTAALAPGAMWKVDNTGGMFGPDIARLDPATGRTDLGGQLTTELRQQIATGLQRQQLPAGGTTPGSATEYMVREKEQLRSYRGAYGRMVEEFVPKLFWRGVEIAFNLGLIPRKIEFDQMLMQLDVLSPLAAAMRAQQFEPAFNYLGLVQQTGGDPDEWIDRDALYEAVAYETGVLTEFTKDADERAAYRQQKMAAAAAALQAQAAASQPPPQLPAPGTAT